ncbi:hypothetical protein D3C81_2088730 [compost metagenome]
MFISLTSSPNVVPDPDFLAQCLKDSYEEMKAVSIEAAKAEVPKVPKARRIARKAAAQKVDEKHAL